MSILNEKETEKLEKDYEYIYHGGKSTLDLIDTINDLRRQVKELEGGFPCSKIATFEAAMSDSGFNFPASVNFPVKRITIKPIKKLPDEDN